MHKSTPYVGLGILVIVIALILASTLIARRKGYKFGPKIIVRCNKGHLFTTIWIPGGSLKSIRLGFYRLQFCPVGRHWALVRPVKEAELSETERQAAAENKDSRIPLQVIASFAEHNKALFKNKLPLVLSIIRSISKV